MSWKNSVSIGLFCLLFSCNSEGGKNTSVFQTKYLIEAEDLLEIADDPNIKIIDFRKSGLYLEGHIPGAFNIWRTDIEDPSYPYGGMMAPRESVETLLRSLGITNNDTLIVYDDRGGCDAARLWWVLKNYDVHNVRLLNGGIDPWQRSGGQITGKLPVAGMTSFSLSDAPSLKYHISHEEITKLTAMDNPIILDTRSTDEFSGKRKKKGAFKGGRIPGSIHIDWEQAVDFNSNGRFKPLKELKEVYAVLGADKDQLIITYCHSGVRSAHTTFVLTELLGYTNVKNYDGSWTEWSYYDYPVEKDSLTTIPE